MKRKSVAAVVTAAAMMMSLAACGSSAADSTPAASESTASSETASGEAAPAESEAAADFDTDQDITVISREDGSGTRGAFIELTGVEEKNADGQKVDNTTADAEIANKTDVVLTSVAGNEKAIGYISEPHAAIAWRALRDQLQPGEYGLFLGTAHPAKFKESVEEILQETLPLPKELADRADLPLLSHNLPADFAALRKLMMG